MERNSNFYAFANSVKRFLILLLLCVFAGMASAQSTMTDDQIVQYLISAKNSGKTNTQMATELAQKGVTMTRLQRIKEKYEKQGISAFNLEEGDTGKDNLKKEDKRLRRPDDTRRPKMEVVLEEWEIDTTSVDLMEIEVEEEPERKVFGRDIFNAENLSFEPNLNIATPANYRLGAGDDVYIDVWGASQATIQETISADGTIQIEGLGPVTLAGMTVASANAYLQRELKQIYSSSNIRVTVGQTKTISINVMGEVVTPGTYTLSAFATAFHALYVAGGVNDIGTLRDIKVYRNNRLVATVDVYDYIMNGRQDEDLRLEDNDLIYVGPFTGLVDVTGKVKRPMFYEMRPNESMTTLLKFAGGFSSDAYTGNVTVVRKTGREYSVHTVEEFDFSAFRLLDGDSVNVNAIIPRFSNMVEVKGAVFRPGMYQMDAKIKSVRELGRMADGVTENAFTERALLHRRLADRSLEVLSIDLGGIMEGTKPDVPLRNEDVLTVFSNEEAQQERVLTIHGEVRRPGSYDYAANTTLADLIMLAGGFTEGASNTRIEVARRVLNPHALESGMVMAETFRIELKNGFELGSDSAFVLAPFDEVYVRKSPDYQTQRNVYVGGEVNFEGTYALSHKMERLSDLIVRAGGLTSEAYSKGARLVRTMNEEEIERRKATMKLTQMSTDSIDVKLLDLATTYTVGINLDKAMANPGSAEDLLVREGDRLMVPGMQTTVKINGGVMFPNTVAWRKGFDLKDYVAQCGGYSKEAMRKRAIVININGTVSRARKVKEIQPGSEIIVPLKEARRRMTPAEIGMVGTASASLATMVATIVTLFNK